MTEKIAHVNVFFGDFRSVRDCFNEWFNGDYFVAAFLCYGGIHRSAELARKCNKVVTNLRLHRLNFDEQGLITGISCIEQIDDTIESPDVSVLCLPPNCRKFPATNQVENFIDRSKFVLKICAVFEDYRNISRL